MQLDYISDLHIDFYADNPAIPDINGMLPENPGRALVIAGDLGHCNDQNLSFIQALRSVYQDVILVRGNHDMYLTSIETIDFNGSSKDRWADMLSRSREIPGVHYLDGNVVEIEGIMIGGCGMWCDGSYAKKHFKVTPAQLGFLHRRFSDHKFIRDLGNFTDVCREELAKMEAIIDRCDVIVSHYGPDASHVPAKHHNPLTGFFYFDGSSLLSRAQGKVWIYGHTHDPADFVSEHGCRMVCNPYGYPNERRDLGNKITSLDL